MWHVTIPFLSNTDVICLKDTIFEQQQSLFVLNLPVFFITAGPISLVALNGPWVILNERHQQI